MSEIKSTILSDLLNNLNQQLVALQYDGKGYVIKLGIKNTWVFKETETIECKLIESGEVGSMILIKSKVDGITIDDLYDFAKTVIDTNNIIEKREYEFNLQINAVVDEIEKKRKAFVEELKVLKNDSFEVFEKLEKDSVETKKRLESKTS